MCSLEPADLRREFHGLTDRVAAFQKIAPSRSLHLKCQHGAVRDNDSATLPIDGEFRTIRNLQTENQAVHKVVFQRARGLIRSRQVNVETTHQAAAEPTKEEPVPNNLPIHANIAREEEIG
ncbi:hypothetical protein [Roseibium sediminicola]|uniref:Uncharacterized protein n=1 Tax=Roseibium sediminicola TaxID=2933272 RepID=A0ABT0GUB3_9HYPH|nr:hypothetical protein [Roseibium sp. CAU 1639]MCK7612445.1 hypothetical protein [Roseibium sp. CAU 1639]